jgi:bifunctional N-acetylglucosamine-1-phosphate-uridyltransferase/glucosamine-1-phosphate-acetyltransferase GlmU-like protein
VARIITRENSSGLLAPAIRPELWSALIPAAGRGSRLGFDKPKILFPVGGSTILERLVQLLSPFCAEFVFVLSPDGAPVVEPELRRLLGDRARVALQSSPLGMGDAVACGLSAVRTPFLTVIWGDQFGVKPSSLDFGARLTEGPLAPECVCPTVIRPHPYIHVDRDASGRVIKMLQQREGDVLPPEGESDSGVFFFSADPLRTYLAALSTDPSARGAATGEFNFLPIFPLIDRTPGGLITARIMTEEESVGVNTRADASYLETGVRS